MRHASEFLALIVFSLIASPLPADDTAREIIERGMKARCEKIEALDKQHCEIISMQGKVYSLNPKDDKEMAATGEIQVEWPSSFRWDREFVINGAKTRRTLAIQGDNGWLELAPQAPVEMNFIQMEEVKLEAYGRWLTTLYPLTDKAFTLALLKSSRVGDEDAHVIKATARLRPDVFMYFSKKNGHLLKVAYKARDSGVECRKEHLLSDYKAFDGLTLPAKMIDTLEYNGQSLKKSGEWTITGYKFVDKLGPDVFAIPKKK
jgi:hypothetical protein